MNATYTTWYHLPGPNITQDFINENLIIVGRALALLNQLNEIRLELSLSGNNLLRAQQNEFETELDETYREFGSSKKGS